MIETKSKPFYCADIWHQNQCHLQNKPGVCQLKKWVMLTLQQRNLNIWMQHPTIWMQRTSMQVPPKMGWIENLLKDLFETLAGEFESLFLHQSTKWKVQWKCLKKFAALVNKVVRWDSAITHGAMSGKMLDWLLCHTAIYLSSKKGSYVE